MRLFALCISLLVSSIVLQAQELRKLNLKLSRVESLYDIYPLDSEDGTNLIVGSGGMVLIMKGQELVHEYTDLTGEHLLKIDTFTSNHYIVAGNNGTLLHYYKDEQRWEKVQLPQFKGYCFYEISRINSQEMVICGGRSKVAMGRRAVPNGFVIKTSDGGKTWERIYRKFDAFIWDVEYDSDTDIIYGLNYTVFGNRLLMSADGGDNWQYRGKRERALYHDLKLDNGAVFMVGGETGNVSRSATVSFGDDKLKFSRSGMVFSIIRNENVTVFPGAAGHVVVQKRRSGQWTVLDAKTINNLYDGVFINERKVLLIGSNNAVYVLDIPAFLVNAQSKSR